METNYNYINNTESYTQRMGYCIKNNLLNSPKMLHILLILFLFNIFHKIE